MHALKRIASLLSAILIVSVTMGQAPAPSAATTAVSSPSTKATTHRDVTVVIEALVRYAEQADSSLAEFERRLLAANWLLARPLEPMATRLLLDIPEAHDPVVAAEIVAQARRQLELARSLWADLKDDEGLMSDDDRRRLEDRLDALAAFADAFSAIWPGTDADENRPTSTHPAASPAPQEATPTADADHVANDERRREAASGLSIVLDVSRRDVAAAGNLWQGYLYGTGGRVERALDVLPMALQALTQGDVYGFHARLLRCRFIATSETHGHAAALALLRKMEPASRDWFGTNVHEEQAQRTARLLRKQIAADWAATAGREANPELAVWCDDLVARLEKQISTTDQGDAFLSLGFAVPALVELDELYEALTDVQGLPKDSLPSPPPVSDSSEMSAGTE